MYIKVVAVEKLVVGLITFRGPEAVKAVVWQTGVNKRIIFMAVINFAVIRRFGGGSRIEWCAGDIILFTVNKSESSN